MRCNKAREFLSMGLDGQLPPDSTVDLEQHLDACADCRSYRADLLVGTRLLRATEPALPDNFEWKLQLRLNQTLREAAGGAAFPWEERPADPRRWLRSFGTAAAMGMAAVLALAIFFGPLGGDGLPTAGDTALQAPATAGADRLPLTANLRRGGGLYGGGLTQPVSGGPLLQRTGTWSGDLGWDRAGLGDWRTINRLREENRQLSGMLLQTQRQLQILRAQLDTTATDALDLGTNDR